MSETNNRAEGETMTTLINSFHGTSARTRLTTDDLESMRRRHPANWTARERRTVARLRRRLCGVAGCTCGDDFGVRA